MPPLPPPPYRAVSVRQPYASWIASGRCTVDVHRRSTRYRGELLIVASTLIDPEHDAADYPATEYPRGQAVCVVTIIDSRPMTEDDRFPACRAMTFDVTDLHAWEYVSPRRVRSGPITGRALFRVAREMVTPVRQRRA